MDGPGCGPNEEKASSSWTGFFAFGEPRWEPVVGLQFPGQGIEELSILSLMCISDTVRELHCG